MVSPGGCFFSSPELSTPASPSGLLLLEPSSVLQPYYRYLAIVCFSLCKCLSINFLLTPLYVLEGFQVFCFYIFNHVFHSHLGILDVGQLVGFLGCPET